MSFTHNLFIWIQVKLIKIKDNLYDRLNSAETQNLCYL